jgi:hypothetical protein
MRFKVGDYIHFHNPITKEIMPAIVMKTYGDKMDVFWLQFARIYCGCSQLPESFVKISK